MRQTRLSGVAVVTALVCGVSWSVPIRAVSPSSTGWEGPQEVGQQKLQGGEKALGDVKASIESLQPLVKRADALEFPGLEDAQKLAKFQKDVGDLIPLLYDVEAKWPKVSSQAQLLGDLFSAFGGGSASNSISEAIQLAKRLSALLAGGQALEEFKNRLHAALDDLEAAERRLLGKPEPEKNGGIPVWALYALGAGGAVAAITALGGGGSDSPVQTLPSSTQPATPAAPSNPTPAPAPPPPTPTPAPTPGFQNVNGVFNTVGVLMGPNQCSGSVGEPAQGNVVIENVDAAGQNGLIHGQIGIPVSGSIHVTRTETGFNVQSGNIGMVTVSTGAGTRNFTSMVSGSVNSLGNALTGTQRWIDMASSATCATLNLNGTK